MSVWRILGLAFGVPVAIILGIFIAQVVKAFMIGMIEGLNEHLDGWAERRKK